jgi:hypothetical protein
MFKQLISRFTKSVTTQPRHHIPSPQHMFFQYVNHTTGHQGAYEKQSTPRLTALSKMFTDTYLLLTLMQSKVNTKELPCTRTSQNYSPLVLLHRVNSELQFRREEAESALLSESLAGGQVSFGEQKVECDDVPQFGLGR